MSVGKAGLCFRIMCRLNEINGRKTVSSKVSGCKKTLWTPAVTSLAYIKSLGETYGSESQQGEDPVGHRHA